MTKNNPLIVGAGRDLPTTIHNYDSGRVGNESSHPSGRDCPSISVEGLVATNPYGKRVKNGGRSINFIIYLPVVGAGRDLPTTIHNYDSGYVGNKSSYPSGRDCQAISVEGLVATNPYGSMV